jgi:hypothetical protein
MKMRSVADTMERLDNTLDTVEELIRDLPIPEHHKKRLCDTVYDLWMDVEESVEMIPADFP